MLSCCDADGEIFSVPEFFAVGKTFRALFWCAVKGGGHCQFLNISVIYKVHLRRVPRPSVFINHLTLPRLPPSCRREGQTPVCTDESLHRTSNQKIVRYEPGARLSPIWPVARYRPPIFPCSGSVAADEAPGAPESVCVADHHWPRLPWAGASDHGRSHKRHRQASDHRDREIFPESAGCAHI